MVTWYYNHFILLLILHYIFFLPVNLECEANLEQTAVVERKLPEAISLCSNKFKARNQKNLKNRDQEIRNKPLILQPFHLRQ